MLRDVSHIDTSVDLFQRIFPIPVGIAPSDMQRLAGPEGEIGMAKAAAAVDLNLTLSSNSTALLEDVALFGLGVKPNQRYHSGFKSISPPT